MLLITCTRAETLESVEGSAFYKLAAWKVRAMATGVDYHAGMIPQSTITAIASS